MRYSDGKDTFLMSGLNKDIVECWKYCYERFKEQPNDMHILDDIRNVGTIDDKCAAIFGYMVSNTYYRLDDDGVQKIKSPARLLDDKCGDCKSYTMFLASCLHCLGIPHIVRFVNFDGGNQYTHVYCVALDENNKEIIMDACELAEDGTPYFGYAREYNKKKDIYYGR